MPVNGAVYWITGLAGSGKTTLGTRLHQRLQTHGRAAALLDGDELRTVFGGGAGHSRAERLALALQYSRLCELLAGQGLDVVCATISLFAEVHRRNRQHLGDRYLEVFVECPLEELIRRDQKGLYGATLDGAGGQVVGLDQRYDRPEAPDLVLDNTHPIGLEEKVDAILETARRRGLL